MSAEVEVREKGGLQAGRALPAGWRWVRVGDACAVEMGQSPPGESYNNVRRGMPLLNGPTEFGVRHPVAVQWTSQPTRNCRPGDILFCVRGATTGRKSVADQAYCIGRGLAAIRAKDGMACTDFVWYALDIVAGKILAKAAGSTFANLPGVELSGALIPLPPLPEQQRIAAILTEQTAAVVRARQAAEERMQAIRALPAAYRNEVFPTTSQKIPTGWRWVRLCDVSEVISGQHILESDYSRSRHGTGYLTGPADFGETTPVITKWTNKPRVLCEPSDVLLTVKGAGVGKVNLSPGESVAIGRQLMAVRGKPNLIDRLYLFNFLKTRLVHFQESALGATVPGLDRGDLETLLTPLPPLPVQQRIASDLAVCMIATKQARQAAEAELASINALPAALLRRAFSGEL